MFNIFKKKRKENELKLKSLKNAKQKLDERLKNNFISHEDYNKQIGFYLNSIEKLEKKLKINKYDEF